MNYNNEVSSHNEVSFTVKCGIVAVVSFSVTMQVAASLLEQAIYMFYSLPSTVLSTTVTMENHNG